MTVTGEDLFHCVLLKKNPCYKTRVGAVADGTFLEKKLVFNKDCNSVNQMFISHFIFENIWEDAR